MEKFNRDLESSRITKDKEIIWEEKQYEKKKERKIEGKQNSRSYPVIQLTPFNVFCKLK